MVEETLMKLFLKLMEKNVSPTIFYNFDKHIQQNYNHKPVFKLIRLCCLFRDVCLCTWVGKLLLSINKELKT